MERRELSARLIFYCGAMGNGKTANLIGTYYAMELANFPTAIIKPMVDTKGDNRVVARSGQSLETDFLIGKDDNICDKLDSYLLRHNKELNVIIVDEAQFLKEHHVDELASLVYDKGYVVICYGLLTDFQEKMFEGSRRLIEVGAEINRLTIPCECGRDRTHNLRLVNGVPVFEGKQVEIDGANDKIEYRSMCGRCFLQHKRRVLKKDANQETIPGFGF